MQLPSTHNGAPTTLNFHGCLYDLDRPKVMSIINVTPDSFYAGSRMPDMSVLAERIAAMAPVTDIFDVGGCSTRPGSTPPDAEEEYRRLAPAIECIRQLAPEIPISVDTFRADVARRCVEEWGVEIINDVGGGAYDERMWETVADLRTAYVLTHTRGTPAEMSSMTDYGDVTCEVLRDLADKVRALHLLGVADIIVDPGFGFAKSVDQNYRLLSELPAFLELGHPLLAGISRKSMIWRPLQISPDDALPGSLALAMAAVERGASILRVHDPAETRQIVQVFELLKKNSI